MERPSILLDVDGVVNANRGHTTEWAFEPQFRSNKASGGYLLNLSREMARALESLNCDIHWLTTWAEHADANIATHFQEGTDFNWRNLPVLANPNSDHLHFGAYYGAHWKPKAVMDFLAQPGPPVVWIDDDARGYMDMPWEHFGWTLDPHDRLLVVSPYHHTGISREDIATIREWLTGRGHTDLLTPPVAAE
jgi:hypothetical protein